MDETTYPDTELRSVELDVAVEPEQLEFALTHFRVKYRVHVTPIPTPGLIAAGGWPVVRFVGTATELRELLLNFAGDNKEHASAVLEVAEVLVPTDYDPDNR